MCGLSATTGHSVTVVTDHSAVKAVLGASNPSSKHALWWGKVYGCGAKSIKIVYRPGGIADALSRMPHLPAPSKEIGEGEAQAGMIRALDTTCITDLLEVVPTLTTTTQEEFGREQLKDASLEPLMSYLVSGAVPTDTDVARRVMAQAPYFTVSEGVLYISDAIQREKLHIIVPSHLTEEILQQCHVGKLAQDLDCTDVGETVVVAGNVL